MFHVKQHRDFTNAIQCWWLEEVQTSISSMPLPDTAHYRPLRKPPIGPLPQMAYF